MSVENGPIADNAANIMARPWCALAVLRETGVIDGRSLTACHALRQGSLRPLVEQPAKLRRIAARNTGWGAIATRALRITASSRGARQSSLRSFLSGHGIRATPNDIGALRSTIAHIALSRGEAAPVREFSRIISTLTRRTLRLRSGRLAILVWLQALSRSLDAFFR